MADISEIPSLNDDEMKKLIKEIKGLGKFLRDLIRGEDKEEYEKWKSSLSEESRNGLEALINLFPPFLGDENLEEFQSALSELLGVINSRSDPRPMKAFLEENILFAKLLEKNVEELNKFNASFEQFLRKALYVSMEAFRTTPKERDEQQKQLTKVRVQEEILNGLSIKEKLEGSPGPGRFYEDIRNAQAKFLEDIQKELNGNRKLTQDQKIEIYFGALHKVNALLEAEYPGEALNWRFTTGPTRLGKLVQKQINKIEGIVDKKLDLKEFLAGSQEAYKEYLSKNVGAKKVDDVLESVYLHRQKYSDYSIKPDKFDEIYGSYNAKMFPKPPKGEGHKLE